MIKQTAELHLSDPPHKNAKDLWENLIFPLINSKGVACGSDEALQLFYDLIYLMMSAHIRLAGLGAAESLEQLIKDAVVDLKEAGMVKDEVDISDFFEQTSKKQS